MFQAALQPTMEFNVEYEHAASFASKEIQDFRSRMQSSRDAYIRWRVELALALMNEQTSSNERQTDADVQQALDTELEKLREEGDKLSQTLAEAQCRDDASSQGFNEALLLLEDAVNNVQKLLEDMEHCTRMAVKLRGRCENTRNSLESLQSDALVLLSVRKQVSLLEASATEIEDEMTSAHSTMSAEIASKEAKLAEQKALLADAKEKVDSCALKLEERASELKELCPEIKFLEESAKQLTGIQQTVKSSEQLVDKLIKQAQARSERTQAAVRLAEKGTHIFKQLIEQQAKTLQQRQEHSTSLESFHLKEFESRRNDLSAQLTRLDNERYKTGLLSGAVRFHLSETKVIAAKNESLNEMHRVLVLENDNCIAALKKVERKLTLAEGMASQGMSELANIEERMHSTNERRDELFNSCALLESYLSRLEMENDEARGEVRKQENIVKQLHEKLRQTRIEKRSNSRLLTALKNGTADLNRDAQRQAELELLQKELDAMTNRKAQLLEKYEQRPTFNHMIWRYAEVEDLKKAVLLSEMKFQGILREKKDSANEAERKLSERIEELMVNKRSLEMEKRHLLSRQQELLEKKKYLKKRSDAVGKNDANGDPLSATAEASVGAASDLQQKQASGSAKKSISAATRCAMRLRNLYMAGLIDGANTESRFAGFEEEHRRSATAKRKPLKDADNTLCSILPKRSNPI
uniref:Uncharacterized protein n=1 Tax=Trichuris muris TaxID=70415 RepID=A0A5S6Q9U9_TRIMR